MFNDYDIVTCPSHQLGSLDDGVELEMCQQRAVGSTVPTPSWKLGLTSLPDFAESAKKKNPSWALIKCLCGLTSAPAHGRLEGHRRHHASEVRFLFPLVTVCPCWEFTSVTVQNFLMTEEKHDPVWSTF